MNLKKNRNNRKTLRRNIKAGSNSILLDQIHKVQNDTLKFYYDLKNELDYIKKQNTVMDLEKNINHCTDLHEKKKLVKKALDLHKNLYPDPEHKVYNKFLKDIHDNIKIETLTGTYGSNFIVIDTS